MKDIDQAQIASRRLRDLLAEMDDLSNVSRQDARERRMALTKEVDNILRMRRLARTRHRAC